MPFSSQQGQISIDLNLASSHLCLLNNSTLCRIAFKVNYLSPNLIYFYLSFYSCIHLESKEHSLVMQSLAVLIIWVYQQYQSLSYSKMKGQQITPWSIYKQKAPISPFKLQNKILQKKEKSKLILPQIESSLYAMQIIVKNKLENQQPNTLRRQDNKTTPLMTSVNKLVKSNRKMSDHEKPISLAQQNSKAKQIQQQKQLFQNQIESFVTIKILYQQLKNEEEKTIQKVEPKEQIVQLVKCESQVLTVNQNRLKNSELFPDIKGNRIHNSIHDITQDKIKEVLNNKTAVNKISQRLKFLWQSKSMSTSINK